MSHCCLSEHMPGECPRAVCMTCAVEQATTSRPSPLPVLRRKCTLSARLPGATALWSSTFRSRPHMPSCEHGACACSHTGPQMGSRHWSRRHAGTGRASARTLLLGLSATAARTVMRACAVQGPARWSFGSSVAAHAVTWARAVRVPARWSASCQPPLLTPSREHVPCACLHDGF
jgi:hypothetical protein